MFFENQYVEVSFGIVAACQKQINAWETLYVPPISENNGLQSTFLLIKVTPAIVRPMRIWSDEIISTKQLTNRPEVDSPTSYHVVFIQVFTLQNHLLLADSVCHMNWTNLHYLILEARQHSPMVS